MKQYKKAFAAALTVLLPFMMHAQDIKGLTVTTEIDSVYVFGFDLKESRSAKGGIWNLKTGRPVTPLNYSTARKDTINDHPAVMLYREVVPGNHPLNGWETWVLKEEGWVRTDDSTRLSGDQSAVHKVVAAGAEAGGI